ncbi:hypothetical protein IJJ27_00900 [bacterium]|nr:hypothetical protein [bacterium]
MATKTETARKQLLGKLQKLREQLEPIVLVGQEIDADLQAIDNLHRRKDYCFFVEITAVCLLFLQIFIFLSGTYSISLFFLTIFVLLVAVFYERKLELDLEQLYSEKRPKQEKWLRDYQLLKDKNSSWFPVSYMTPAAVDELLHLVEDFKADTLKEALNIYDKNAKASITLQVAQKDFDDRKWNMEVLSFLEQRRTNRLLREANQLTKKQQEQEAMNKRLYGEKHYWEKRHDHGF